MAAGGFSPGSISRGSSSAADVEALIAEAADLVALEQIARLNSAHLPDDALLPADIESRFRRLKSFPAPSTKSPRAPAPLPVAERPSAAADAGEPKPSEWDPPVDKDAIFIANAATIFPVKPGAVDGSQGKPDHGLLLSPPISPVESPSPSPSDGGSPSPPRGRACCFGFTPRKGGAGTKGGGGRGRDVGLGKEDDLGLLLSDLGPSSLREQRRSMRRVMREEEKVVREARRMVEWVKQASARMEVSAAAVDEMLSDLEDEGRSK